MSRAIIRILEVVVCCFTLAMAQTPDRSVPPQPGPPPSLHLAAIEHFKLSNGIPVILLQKHNLPLVQVEAIVRAGTACDPETKRGLATITAAMMEEGTESRSSLEFADAVDYLGAHISAFAGWHSSGASLHCTFATLDSALALFADMVLRPAFPPSELVRVRKERFTTLMEWRDDPLAIASILSQKVLYGVGHPYGSPTIGDIGGLRSITVEDIRNFHNTYFHANNAAIVVVGDISGDLVIPKLEKTFGMWTSAPVPVKQPAEVHQVEGRTIYLVDKPGAAQSEIIFARIGTSRVTPDYFSIQVMNDILGGAFTSRLNENLRETHGYTYGAGSLFDFRMFPGPFTAHAAVQTEVTDKSLVEFMNEFNGIQRPVTDAELMRAENYLTLRYPEGFETVESIAGKLVELVIYQLPDDYFNSFTEKILSVSRDDVLHVSQKYIDPDNMAIVVVGDRKRIERGILELHMGAVKFLTSDDVLGPPPTDAELH